MKMEAADSSEMLVPIYSQKTAILMVIEFAEKINNWGASRKCRISEVCMQHWMSRGQFIEAEK
jgi:hypothetical protein